MSATTISAGDVNAEAKRILAMSISKLYASRTQRGGLRLHRSLLLSLVMRTTRDIYHSACLLACPEKESDDDAQPATEEPMDTTSSRNQDEHSQSQPTLTPAAETAPETPSQEEITADKENVRPAAMSPARRSRKRRGNASVAPDFLPSKRARLEPGEERHAAPLGMGTVGFGNCRVGESLTTLSLHQIVHAF